jgi:ferredoxin
MEIKNATVAYFSGTGTTEKYARALADALPYPTEIAQIKTDAKLKQAYAADELFVLAVPVFGGFAPEFVWQQLKDLHGENAPAVIVAVFGARDYDNTLLETQTELEKKGFTVVGAAAFVARHSIIQTIAADRPNADDLAEAQAFGEKIAARLQDMGSISDAPSFSFKGKLEKEEGGKLTPIVTDDCISCGICAGECPAGAIPDDAPNTTNTDACASCLHCIEVCPVDARKLPDPVIEHISGLLAKLADPAKANEVF